MAVDHKIVRAPESFRGLDKRSSDIARTIEFATEIRNAAFRVSGAINKRKGFQHINVNQNEAQYAAGMTTFSNVDTSTGRIEQQVIRIEHQEDSVNGSFATLKRLQSSYYPLLSTYIRIDLTSAVLLTHDYFYTKILDETTKTYKITIKRVNKTTSVEEDVLNVDVGTGKEVSTDPAFYSITDLQTAINALGSFGLSAPFINNGSTSAALLIGEVTSRNKILSETEVALDSAYTNIAAENWVDLPLGDTAYTDLLSLNAILAPNELDSELENATFAQLNNVLYISNGYCPVLKWDGEKLYRAGLPGLVKDVIPGTWAYDQDTVVSNTTASGSIHSGTYYYKIVLEYTDAKGNFITSQPSDPIDVSHSSNASVGFSINSSVFDGLHRDVSHLKYSLYRTIEGAATTDLYYKVGTVGFNSSIIDNLNDTTLQTKPLLVDPIKRHDPPPIGRYLSVYKNCLVVSGQRLNVNNLQYSLPKNAATGEIGSEYFPDDDNGVVIQSSFGDRITGIAPLRDLLYVFHRNSIHVLSGNINELEVPTTDLITREGNVGCQSHSSIEELNNTLIFLSQNGVYSIDSSNALTELSSLIKPIFLDKDLKRKRAVTFNWTEKNMLLFFIPKETIDVPSSGGSSFYIAKNLSTSVVLAYDYYKQAWLQWDTLDFSGGISSTEDKTYFAGRSTNLFTNFFLDNGDTYDYRDHNEAIKFNYETNWESLQEPTIPKKYLRLKIHSFDSDGLFESPQGFQINAFIQKEYVPVDLGNIEFDFGRNAGGGWGSFQWGSGAWGSIATDSVKSKLPTGKSKCMKLRFVNEDINENVLITTYELEIAAPFQTEVKE